MAAMEALARPERGYFDWKPGFCGGYLLRYERADRERPLLLIKTLCAQSEG